MTVPTVTALQAQAEASLFLSDRLSDRISASTPCFDEGVWRVPVILAYPYLGVLGKVGEIVVSATESEVISFTPVEEMLKTASTSPRDTAMKSKVQFYFQRIR